MYQLAYSDIAAFGEHLRNQEKSVATVQKYTSTLQRFFEWLPETKYLDKETMIAYKEKLSQNHVPAGVNVILAAINVFFRFKGWTNCIVKALRIQRQVFSSPEKELSKEEYRRLVNTARQDQNHRLELLLQLMASTGIRVSEIRYVTTDAVTRGSVQISLKGKTRTILLPRKLCRALIKYQRQLKIQNGPLFRTRNGNSMDRRQIWAQMKELCSRAGIDSRKVFPHNLRHLFARTFYRVRHDISKLADLLGHSNIETTRLYLISTGYEHQKLLEKLNLLC